MNIIRVSMIAVVVAGLLLAAGCGRQTPPAPPATEAVTPAATATPAEAEPAVLEQNEEADLQKLEAAAPAYQPVTRSNYQEELAKMESEVNAEN